ncbi:MAG: HyaD/HybD family hydrogenase maturation endopeptidase [Gammaproteobacteria bacterium]
MTEDIVPSLPEGDPVGYETLILGIGNPLWADEGFGVRAAEELNASYEFPPDVRVMDGGTLGLFLLPYVRAARKLLIFDAIDFGLEPAEMKVIVGDEVPKYLGVKKMSMHQTSFQEVLASAQMFGEGPEQLALVGVQPELLNDYGGSLRDSVKARLPQALAEGVRILQEWGIEYRKRDKPLAKTDLTGPDAINMEDYETGRPDTKETWR